MVRRSGRRLRAVDRASHRPAATLARRLLPRCVWIFPFSSRPPRRRLRISRSLHDGRIFRTPGAGCSGDQSPRTRSARRPPDPGMNENKPRRAIALMTRPAKQLAPEMAACLAALLYHALAASAAPEPVRLHPDNPHYFLWRGKPTILLTASEHYGAVINLDFDYGRYLDELKKHRLNLARVFSGAYRERAGTFHIAGNTLAPAAGRFLCPWAQSAIPAQEGRTRFDL